MYFGEVWASCRRRWYVLLALLTICAGMMWFAADQVKPSYDVESSLLLLPPQSVEEPASNRYLELSSLTDSVDVLARSMRSAETVKALEGAAPDATHDVVPDQTTSAPILLVTATGPTKDSAADMLEAILANVPSNLADLQENIGIRTERQITVMTIAGDPEPIANQKTRLRVLALIAGVMLLSSALLVAAIDGLLIRRSARRTPPDESPEEDKPAPRDLFKRRPSDLTSERSRRTGN